MGQKVGEASSRWRTESIRWNWRERAEAWDEQERPQQQADRLARIEAAQARHLECFLLQQEKAMAALDKLDPSTLTPDQALRLMQSGIDGERRCLEEPAVAELQRQVDELIRQREEGTG